MSNQVREPTEYRVPDQYASEYLARNEGLTIASTTAETYDSVLSRFVSFLHDREITVLSAEFADVREYMEFCVRCGNRQSTLSGKLSTIGELYRYIKLRSDAADDLELDPLRFREIDLAQYNTPAKIEREALSKEEIRRLFDAFNSYRNRLMTIVGVETGMRNSDIRNIRIEDIGDSTIFVHDPKNSKPYDVPISTELRFELRHWQKQHRRGYTYAEDSQFMFPSQQGKRLETNSSLNRIVKTAAERAGIQEVIGTTQVPESQKQNFGTGTVSHEMHRVTPHTLRHSFVTLLKDAGVKLPYRQLAANHASAATTLEYEHGKDDVFEPLRDKFDPPR